MNLKEARAAIEEILDSIPDKYLPAFDRVEVREDGTTCVWYGSHGRHLGSAKSNGKRDPSIYRSSASWDAIEGEMVHRADRKFLENGDKPHGIRLAKKTELR